MVFPEVLYCFYTKEIFECLEARGYGCWIEGEYCGVWGYSDDTYLIAPSLEALQKMIKTCEEYANEHNLHFSTDPNPEKCKTKCIAFLAKERTISHMVLCGNSLPWVREGLHLGHLITNSYDGMRNDILMKRGKFLQRNCEILQECWFCHPKTKFFINNVYNSHMTYGQRDIQTPERH